MPSCSTLLLLYPSMPTQNAASCVVRPEQLAEGSVQLAVTVLNVVLVSA